MKLLLDTHTLLWWLTDDGRLSAAARRAIRTLGNDVYASAVSGWEIATKHRKGRLPEAEEAVHRLPALLVESNIRVLQVTLEHALRAGGLPQPHRDPFDRMLAAQAQLDGLTIVSNDRQLRQFGMALLW